MSDEERDNERDLERQWWAHPVTQSLFRDLAMMHDTALTHLRGEAQLLEENLPAIKYYSGRTEAFHVALGLMKGRDGEGEDE